MKKFYVADEVQLKNGIPGIVIAIAAPIDTLVPNFWYQVRWVDGNESIHVEQDLCKSSK